MSFSVGILYSAQDFLDLCARRPFTLDDIRASFSVRFGVAAFDAVLESVRECRWVTFDDSGALIITREGEAVRNAHDQQHALRIQTRHYIDAVRPAWGALVTKGRKEAASYFSRDVLQVFKEADLLDGYSDDVVAWWDESALVARGRLSDILVGIGRTAERLSRQYEFERTGKMPEWIAVESNLVGYDLLSIVERDDPRPLRIEVKGTSQAGDHIVFYLSRGEWECAEGEGTHIFHLWRLEPEPKLAVVDAATMAQHVAADRGLGRWVEMTLPFEGIAPA